MPTLPGALRLFPFRVGMVAPFRGLVAREGVVIGGPAGWGEFSPFADYTPAQDALWLRSALSAARDPRPQVIHEQIPVNAVLPELPLPELVTAAEHAVTVLGCITVKLKVGSDVEANRSRVGVVRAVLDAAGGGSIRLDANGQWDVAGAMEQAAQLAPFDIEYIEQPCASSPELRQLRAQGFPVAIAADESIRRDHEWQSIVEFADVAVLKVSPLGGPDVIRDITAAVGVPVVLSGAMETSIGLHQDIAVAASLPELPMACGFGTGALLADDLVRAPILPRGGSVSPSAPEVDDDALAEARDRLGDDASAEWMNRLENAWRLLPGEDR